VPTSCWCLGSSLSNFQKNYKAISFESSLKTMISNENGITK
jgi:hypothetical protein